MATLTRFTLEELLRLPSFYLPIPSYDGTQVAYFSDETGRIELWVLEVATGERRQVSHGEVPRSIRAPVVWDRQGTALAFARDAGGNEQHDVWLFDLESGVANQVTETPSAQEIPVEFSPDNQRLSFLSTRNGQLDLYTMGRDGSEVMQLTTATWPVQGGRWSPDGTHLTVMTNESSNLKNVDVYLAAADASGVRKVWSTRDGARDVAVDWSPDGRLLAVTSDESGVSRPGVLDVETGRVRRLGSDGVEESSLQFSPDGRLLLTVRNENARLFPVIHDLEADSECVPALPAGASIGFPSDASFAGASTAQIAFSTDQARPSLCLYDLQSGETRTLLAPEYGPIDPAVFVPAEDVYYKTFDGLQIHALLYRPRGIVEGERVPAMVVPHGGPTGQYSHGFNAIFQFFANEGYAVLAPNIRGSTGYGVAFRDMALKDWGGGDLQDLVAGRAYLTALPYVDPERVVIWGGSYGGYMTFMAVTKEPALWQIGVPIVGISDLQALYSQSMPHFKYYLQEQMGDPEENADLWQDRSAANFAGNVQAKLMILHGVNDPRCPISQARIFRDRLLEAGKIEGRDFEYVEFGEEGHGSTDQAQRLRMYGAVSEFLHRSLSS
jgi:dipeptidyl aminopeptidase/acylaminoacyl peptidase